MRVLKNMITLVDWIPPHIEFAIIGAVILAGVAADEIVKRLSAKRRGSAHRIGVHEKVNPNGEWAQPSCQIRSFLPEPARWEPKASSLPGERTNKPRASARA